ncbi:MAG: hypothetical protein ACKVP5_19940 [Aestuariivirga sp.]
MTYPILNPLTCSGARSPAMARGSLTGGYTVIDSGSTPAQIGSA